MFKDEAAMELDQVKQENSALRLQIDELNLKILEEISAKTAAKADATHFKAEYNRVREERTKMEDNFLAAMKDKEDALRLNGDLQKKVDEQRRMLWWVARNAGLSLHIPKAELDSIPDGAELLVWYEKLFDSMILKGICSPGGGEKVTAQKED